MVTASACPKCRDARWVRAWNAVPALQRQRLLDRAADSECGTPHLPGIPFKDFLLFEIRAKLGRDRVGPDPKTTEEKRYESLETTR
jgi:hypothetical protein